MWKALKLTLANFTTKNTYTTKKYIFGSKLKRMKKLVAKLFAIKKHKKTKKKARMRSPAQFSTVISLHYKILFNKAEITSDNYGIRTKSITLMHFLRWKGNKDNKLKQKNFQRSSFK